MSGHVHPEVGVDMPAAIRAWRDDPVKAARDLFNLEPDWFQREFLSSMATGTRRVAMKACKGPGKSAILAVGAWIFLLTHYHGRGKAVSISRDNLRDGLWRELAKWRKRSRIVDRFFSQNADKCFAREHPDTWYLAAAAYPKSADPEEQANTLAGVHEEGRDTGCLFVIDESGGVPVKVAAAAEAALSTEGRHFFWTAGNPTSTSGLLYHVCTRQRSGWHVIEITGDPDDPRRAKRVSIEWAREQIQLYGRENPWVLVNVFGQFPPAAFNKLFGVEQVSEAMRRVHPEDAYVWQPGIMGVDLADYGDDRSVIALRQGPVAYPFRAIRNANAPELAGQIADTRRRWEERIVQPVTCFLDRGFNPAIYDYLDQIGEGYVGVHFASRADNPEVYANVRVEMWERAADWVQLKGGALPDDPELLEELTEVEYTFRNDGRKILEPKDNVKERLGRSPDKADALALTFRSPVAVHDPRAELRRSRRTRLRERDYHPVFDDQENL